MLSTLVNKLNHNELAVGYAASKIISRTFEIKSIRSKLDEKFSEPTIRSAINSLVKKGILSIIQLDRKEMKDKIIVLTFTTEGRNACSLIKDAYLIARQPQLV